MDYKTKVEQILDSLTHRLLLFYLFNYNPYAHMYDDQINLRFLYIFGGSGLLCGGDAAATVCRCSK